ncbi:MAG: RNA-binding domain-containing protein [Promethearchaeota archaeon]
MISIKVTVPLFPTENKESVVQAIENIFPVDRNMLTYQPASIEKTFFTYPGTMYSVPVTIITLDLTGREALMKIHHLLRKQLIVETARRYFQRSMKGRTSIEILLHKQAAFKSKIHFSEEDESPMGPIRVTITSSGDIQQLVDWLAPPTRNGNVIEPSFTQDQDTRSSE